MLYERGTQLATLASLVDDLRTAGGKVVLIRGEAGIGKTALVTAFLAEHAASCHVLIGACDDLLTPEALGPFWDMARDEPEIAAALDTASRPRLFGMLVDLLSRSLRPTLMAIEDTQWADDATLDAIKYLGRRIGRTNGLLVLTYRDTELETEHPLRQVIGDLPPGNVERFQLQPLSTSAVEAMIGSRRIDVARVVAQTDGNPLFVTELLANDDSDSIPASINETVTGRLARVSDDARIVLEVVAVMPGEVARSLVQTIAGPAFDALAECEHTGLLRSVGESVGYVHELLRRAVEVSIPSDRRQGLNRAVLGALPDSADPARFAHHAREAGDIDAILRYAPAAARAASAADSLTDSIAHYRVAEPYLDRLPPREAGQILHDLAQQELDHDDPMASAHIERAVELRRSLDDPLSLSSSLLLQSMVEYRSLDTESALTLVQEAVDVASVDQRSREYARALRMLGYVTWLHFEDIPSSLPIVDAALEIAREIDDPLAEMEAMTTKGNIEYSIGMPGGMELIESVRAIAERTGDRWREVGALQNMSGMAADFRNMTLAVDYARRALETSIRYEQRALEKGTLAMYAEMLMWLGEWDEAIDAATGAFDGQAYTEAIAWRVIGTIETRRHGTPGRAPLERMWEISKSTKALTTADPCASALAEYMWLTGDQDSVWLERCDELLAMGRNVGDPWPSGALAFWMWKLGRIDDLPEGSADFYMWIPKGELDRAAPFWADRGIHYEEALALMHGDTPQMIRALRIFEDLGADAAAARVRADLVQQGVAIPRGRSRAAREHAAGLTGRQAEVLEYLAKGLTNTQIADELFLSHRTVENHVAAILVKLDAPTRADAVDAAMALGILTLTDA